MAKRPLIESEVTRAGVIALAMLAVLVLSLAMALPLTSDHAVVVGDLELRVPARWRRVGRPIEQAPPEDPTDDGDPAAVTDGEADAAPADDRNASASATFRFSRDSQDQLIVRALPQATPRTPTEVLGETVTIRAARAGRGRSTRKLEVSSIRVGQLTGVIYRGISYEPNNMPFVMKMDQLADFTDDGRQHWMIEHHDALLSYSGDVIDAPPFNRTLFERVVHSVGAHRLQPASDAQAAAAGLPTPVAALVPAGLRALTSPGHREGDPILFLPTTDQVGLQLLRVRADLDLTDDERDSNLSPRALLANAFEGIHERSPRDDELSRGDADGLPAWRLVMTPGSRTALARHVWCVRHRPGRMLIIDVLASADALTAATRLVAPLAKAAAAADTSTPDGADQAVQDALRRGRDVARWQYEHGPDLLTPHEQHWLLHQTGPPIGLFTNEMARAAADAEFPLVAKSVTLWAPSGPVMQWGVARWRLSPDGARFAVSVRRRANVGPKAGKTLGYDGNGDESELHMTEVGDGEDARRWTVARPEAFVPPMNEDYWPTDAAGPLADGPALVWLWQGATPPGLHWVELESREGQHPSVRVRQVLTLDAARVRYDASGEPDRFTWLTGDDAGPAEIVAQRAEVADVLKVYPGLNDLLRKVPDDPTNETD